MLPSLNNVYYYYYYYYYYYFYYYKYKVIITSKEQKITQLKKGVKNEAQPGIEHGSPDNRSDA